MAAPFIKYCGGKRKLAPRIAELLLPNSKVLQNDARYYEPFLGGGAVFFHLVETGRINSHQAILTDVNEDLVNTYRVIRDHVDGLIIYLEVFAKEHCEEFYYSVRCRFNEKDEIGLIRAAEFIYLNKTCFNGLYRVNKAGEFNVPFGKYVNPTICDAEGLRAASKALEGTRIERASFEEIFGVQRANDIVYADPPYVEIVKGGFTQYAKEGFTESSQKALVNDAQTAIAMGSRIVLSNHDTEEVRNWYSNPVFTFETIQVARPINRDGDKRGKVAEVLIYGGGAE